MANLRWEETYSVGVEELDEQHRQLIRLINRIPDRAPDPEALRALARVLRELAAYAVHHFDTEERYLEQAGYPQLAEHRLQHQGFRQRVGELVARYRDAHEVDPEALLQFLVEWLLDHILQADAAYAPYLRGRG